jgi:hypothetical protein
MWIASDATRGNLCKMSVTATFDSNVWRQVVSPERFPNDTAAEAFLKLYAFAKIGHLRGMLSETMFNLEPIPKKERAAYFRCYKPKATHSVISHKGGVYHGRVQIGPDLLSHPGNSPNHKSHLRDALALGFKLLTCQRTGMPRSPDTDPSMFLAQTDCELKDVLEQLEPALDFVSGLGAGFEHARALGNRFRQPEDQVWYEGFFRVPEDEKHLVWKAVAEWADGDSIATHIAHRIEYFCTRDRAVGGGAGSVLSSTNRDTLNAKFGIVFVTPEELVPIIENKLPRAS